MFCVSAQVIQFIPQARRRKPERADSNIQDGFLESLLGVPLNSLGWKLHSELLPSGQSPVADFPTFPG